MQPDTKQRKPAMEVRDLFFLQEKQSLKGHVFYHRRRKITTIMGANGCGKSTLFNLMTKNLYPRKGNIFLYGKNIQNLGLKDFAKRVSIVHQYNSSADDITVERLVSFGRTPHRKMMQGRRDEDEKMIRWAMEVTNILKYRDKEVSRLSGGQRQRCGSPWRLRRIRRSFFWMNRPPIWISVIRSRS